MSDLDVAKARGSISMAVYELSLWELASEGTDLLALERAQRHLRLATALIGAARSAAKGWTQTEAIYRETMQALTEEVTASDAQE
jgi:hypothetical protein